MLTIYLVQAGDHGPVKAALTTGTALQRLQAGNPQPLIVRAIYEADDRSDLRALHEEWAPHHLRADWFTPDVLQLDVQLRPIDFDQAAQQRRLQADAEAEAAEKAARMLAHYARTRP